MFSLMFKIVSVKIPKFHEWLLLTQVNQTIFEDENFQVRKRNLCLTMFKHDLKYADIWQRYLKEVLPSNIGFSAS